MKAWLRRRLRRWLEVPLDRGIGRQPDRQAPAAVGATSDTFRNFERGFSPRHAGCRGSCQCGRVFYNPNGGWDWECGELEELEANANATALDYSVEFVYLEGKEYAADCECWHARATRLIVWLQHHADEIAEFLRLEKRRKEIEAARSPVVE